MVDDVLSPEVIKQIDEWARRYPEKERQSAVLTALTLAQEAHGGWLTQEVMDAVAGHLGMESMTVYEIATFYSLLDVGPVGHHKISICNNLSCMLCGAEDLVAHVERRLGISMGETTSDGRITLRKEEECLAACGGAPMMTVDGRYYESLTLERVDEILDGLR